MFSSKVSGREMLEREAAEAIVEMAVKKIKAEKIERNPFNYLFI